MAPVPHDAALRRPRRQSTGSQRGLQLSDDGSVERQIIEGAHRRCAAFGASKTTVADIATEAGVSRATVYRVFPGGRDAIFDAVRRHEVLTFFGRLEAELLTGANLADVLSIGICTAAGMLRDDEEFQRRLAHDPGPLLETLSAEGAQRLFSAARIFVAPHVERFVGRREAERLAEWLTRIVLTYTLEPSPNLDLCDREAVDRFVEARVLPGLVVRLGPDVDLTRSQP